MRRANPHDVPRSQAGTIFSTWRTDASTLTSGSWFKGKTDSYLKQFLNSLNSANWVGHQR
jgi:hypothetical protein